MSMSKTKIIPCYNCGKEVERSIYCTRYFLCEECKSKGIKINNFKKTKILPCYNCGKKVEVNVRCTRYFLCEECKSKGIKIDSYQDRLEKRKLTCLEKYGTEHPLKNEDVKNKIKKTCLEKYGVEHSSKNNLVKNKRKLTCLEKYGTEHPLKNEDVKNKIKKTCLEKYGVEHQLKSTEVQDKIKSTNIKKYGVDNPFKSTEVQNKVKSTRKTKFIPLLKKMLNYLELDIVSDYGNAHDKSVFKCRKCGYEFEQQWNAVQQGYTCPKCYPRNQGYSKGEKELCEFVKSLGLSVIENARTIILPLELDIYIPEKSIAIEYNGLYWHCDERLDKNYHLNKLNQCTENDIRLVQVFEDEWIYKQDIVKARLKAILGKSEAVKIHARKCVIKEVDSKVKNNFLEMYHIQGKDTSKIHLGAYYNNELVAVMTFSCGSIAKGSRNTKGVWELNRFCTNYNYRVIGIASKLLSYFKKHYEWTTIFSYADLRWSDGNLYYQLGFELEHKTEPNYWYVKGLERLHRFGLRKRPNEPKDVPEWLLREAEGYTRVWDCGNLKFLYER